MVRDQRAAAPDRNFLLYLAFGACHGPHHAPAEMIDRYVPVFEKGWDIRGDERIARQLRVRRDPTGDDRPARNPGVAPWDSLSVDERH